VTIGLGGTISCKNQQKLKHNPQEEQEAAENECHKVYIEPLLLHNAARKVEL